MTPTHPLPPPREHPSSPGEGGGGGQPDSPGWTPALASPSEDGTKCGHLPGLCEITNGQDLKLDILINDKEDAQRYKVISCFVKSEIGEMSYEEELPDMWGE